MHGDFMKPVAQLKAWLDRNAVPTDSLTVILNFRDADAAACFDANLRREVEHHQFRTGTSLPLHLFEVMGIKFKLESPVHSP